jgi:NAD-dependent DNA ligase
MLVVAFSNQQPQQQSRFYNWHLKSAMALQGVTICISGTLSVSRAQMKLRIEAEGGKVASSLTKAVTHLLSTQEEVANATAKVLKAQSTDVPIVTEDFIDESIEQGEIQLKPVCVSSLFV